MREEMKDFAFQSEGESSFEMSYDSSSDGSPLRSKRGRKKDKTSSHEGMTLWEKIRKRNREARNRMPAITFDTNMSEIGI
jgi:hypothetical protein